MARADSYPALTAANAADADTVNVWDASATALKTMTLANLRTKVGTAGSGSPYIVDLGTPGTDVTTLLQNAINAASGSGAAALRYIGVVGDYYISAPGLTLPDGFMLIGMGPGTNVEPYSTFASYTARLSAHPTSPPTILISAIGMDGVVLQDVSLDGNALAAQCYKGSGFGHRLINCEMRGATTNNVLVVPDLNGHEFMILGGSYSMNTAGENIRFENNSATSSDRNHDNFIGAGCIIRGGAKQLACYGGGTGGSDAYQLNGLHMYQYPNNYAGGDPQGTHNAYFEDVSHVAYTDVYFDMPQHGVGLEIKCVVRQTHAHSISDTCQFVDYSGATVDNTLPCIRLTGGSTYGIYDTRIAGHFAGTGGSNRRSACYATGGSWVWNLTEGNITARNVVAISTGSPDYSRVSTVLNEGVQQNVVIKDGGWDTAHLTLGAYHLWIDTSGRLRIKSGAPSSATDGTVVGTQT